MRKEVIKNNKDKVKIFSFWFGATAAKYENITSIPPI